MAKKLEQTERRLVAQQEQCTLSYSGGAGIDLPVCLPRVIISSRDIIRQVNRSILNYRLRKRLYRPDCPIGHVNHAERYNSVEMRMTGKSYRIRIPADYTNTQYPLQYYFELKETPAMAWLYPGFSADLTNQPSICCAKGLSEIAVTTVNQESVRLQFRGSNRPISKTHDKSKMEQLMDNGITKVY